MYSCVASHKINGEPKRICLDNGRWSETVPKCEGKSYKIHNSFFILKFNK